MIITDERTFTSEWTGIKKYTIIRGGEIDLFIIDGKNQYLSEVTANRVIEYSKHDNAIIEAFEIGTRDKGNRIVTRYMGDYAPLVPFKYSTFLSNGELRSRGETYRRLIRDDAFVLDFYGRVLDEYIKFYRSTGCYSIDISANNILVNEDFSKFVIIDVQSFCETKCPTFSISIPCEEVMLPNTLPEWAVVTRNYTGLDDNKYNDLVNHLRLIGGKV